METPEVALVKEIKENIPKAVEVQASSQEKNKTNENKSKVEAQYRILTTTKN